MLPTVYVLESVDFDGRETWTPLRLEIHDVLTLPDGHEEGWVAFDGSAWAVCKAHDERWYVFDSLDFNPEDAGVN